MHILSVFVENCFFCYHKQLYITCIGALSRLFTVFDFNCYIKITVLQKNIEDEKRHKTQILVIKLWCYLVIIFCY
jgi:hypothetical protein